MNEDETADKVMQLLGYTVEGNGEAAAHLLQEIGAASSSARMYGVCCAIAEAAKGVLRQLFPAMVWAPSSYLLALHELHPGGLEADRAGTWAARFIVAYANNDTANTTALYDTALHASDDEYTDSIVALLAAFAGLAHTALQRKGIRR